MNDQLPIPLVSIVIPTFNRAGLLKEAVDSALAQTYPCVEVIVVDDGSSDGTPELMAGYASRVKYIRQANSGVSTARNRGFRESSGEFVTFLDDDDIIFPRKIELQAARLREQPNAGFVHCRYYISTFDGKLKLKIGVLPEGDVLSQLLVGNFIWMSAPMIRRSVFEEVGGFDEHFSLAADTDLWLRILLAGYRLACVQQPLGAYRSSPNSMVTNVDQAVSQVLQVIDRVYASPQLPEKALSVKEQAYAYWHFWFSRRYFSQGSYEKGKEHLVQAIHWLPGLIADQEAFDAPLVAEALDLRTRDPIEFINAFFDHLPPEAEAFKSERARLTGRVYLCMGLAECAFGEEQKASAFMRQAFATFPLLAENRKQFSQDAAAFAVNLVDQVPYLRKVYALLPPEGRSLQKTRRAVLSLVHASTGFDEYFYGSKRLAFWHMFLSIYYRPRNVTNRGILSVMIRSIFSLSLPG